MEGSGERWLNETIGALGVALESRSSKGDFEIGNIWGNDPEMSFLLSILLRFRQ